MRWRQNRSLRAGNYPRNCAVRNRERSASWQKTHSAIQSQTGGRHRGRNGISPGLAADGGESRLVRGLSEPSSRVRDVSRLGARHGYGPLVPTDHSENNRCPSVRSQSHLARKSSKRVQTGEPNILKDLSIPVGPHRALPSPAEVTQVGAIVRVPHSPATQGIALGMPRVGPSRLRRPDSPRLSDRLPTVNSPVTGKASLVGATPVLQNRVRPARHSVSARLPQSVFDRIRVSRDHGE